MPPPYAATNTVTRVRGRPETQAANQTLNADSCTPAAATTHRAAHSRARQADQQDAFAEPRSARCIIGKWMQGSILRKGNATKGQFNTTPSTLAPTGQTVRLLIAFGLGSGQQTSTVRS